MGTRLTVLAIALTAATLPPGLAACSSPSQPSAAAALAACRQAPMHVQPRPLVAAARPGAIRWSVPLDRCYGTPTPLWGAYVFLTEQAGTTGPGCRVVLVLNGSVSMYDPRTGARLWRRTMVSPRRNPLVQDVEASAAVVLVALQPVRGAVGYTFLNAANGQPLGRMNTALPGDPFLVGSHVVLTSAGAPVLQGYDPGTGRTLWRDTVPQAPQVPLAAHDASTVYLNSARPGGPAGSTFQREILRIDAATGRRLPPLRLPGRLNVNVQATAAGNLIAQGLLVLNVSSTDPTMTPSGQITYSVTQTIALNPRTGRTAWTRSGNVTAEQAGTFASENLAAFSYTAIDPRTGRALWTVRYENQGLGGGGELTPLIATPGYLTASSTDASQEGKSLASQLADASVIGVSPDRNGGARQAWSSQPLPSPRLVAVSKDTAFVTTCTRWPAAVLDTCARRLLVAIAI